MAYSPYMAVGTVGANFTTVSRVITARADLRFALGTLNCVHCKGDLGEAIAERCFIKNKLGEVVSGRWVSLTPRNGRQGFDHFFGRVDSKGNFKWMVCESKYGTSQLGSTLDGQQMSWNWMHVRAERLGRIYKKLGEMDFSKIDMRGKPWFNLGVKRSYDVFFSDGTRACFWKDKQGWHFDGPMNRLKEAQETATKMGVDLVSPSCNIRGRIFRIKPIPGTNDLEISIERVKSGTNSTVIESTSKGKPIVLEGVLGKKITDPDVKAKLAEKFRKEFPGLNDKEIKDMVDEFCENYNNGGLIKKTLPIAGRIVGQSVVAGVAAATFDSLIQLALSHKVDWAKIGLTFTGTAVGTGVGQALSIVFIKTKSGAQFVRVCSRAFRVSKTAFVRNSLAGGIGSIVTGGIISYGLVWLGRSDWKTANREMIATTVGTLGGAGVSAGVLGFVETFLVADGIYGAAATNSALAILGGGTVASGGGGMAAGMVVLSATAFVAMAVITVSVGFGFYYYDRVQDEKLLISRFQKYSMPGTWNRVAYNRLHLRLRLSA